MCVCVCGRWKLIFPTTHSLKRNFSHHISGSCLRGSCSRAPKFVISGGNDSRERYSHCEARRSQLNILISARRSSISLGISWNVVESVDFDRGEVQLHDRGRSLNSELASAATVHINSLVSCEFALIGRVSRRAFQPLTLMEFTSFEPARAASRRQK